MTTIEPDTVILTLVDRFQKCWVALWGDSPLQAVAYDDLETFQSDPSGYIVDWATAELEDFSPMALQHAVKEFYLAYGTPEEKRAYGVDDRPYTVCVFCHKVVRWNGTALVDPTRETEGDEPWFCIPPDRQPGIAYAEHGHEGKWLTLGEFRDKTKHLPDNMPITGDTQTDPSLAGASGGELDSWVNLRLTHIPESYDYDGDDERSITLDVWNDFDTRQW